MQVQNAKNADISNNTFQAFTNDNDIYLVEHVKKPRNQNGKLKFLIRWLGYSNHQNTWEPEDHLSSALVQEYFQQSLLKNPMPTNKVFLTKISLKGPSITWSCHITHTLVLLCLFILWFLLTKAQPNAVPILDLGPPYDCHQLQHLVIFGFLSLKNCSHSMPQ